MFIQISSECFIVGIKLTLRRTGCCVQEACPFERKKKKCIVEIDGLYVIWRLPVDWICVANFTNNRICTSCSQRL